MIALIGIVSLFLWLIWLVMFIVRAIRKKPTAKKTGLKSLIAFIVMVVMLALTPNNNNKTTSPTEKVAEVKEKDVVSSSDSSDSKENSKEDSKEEVVEVVEEPEVEEAEPTTPEEFVGHTFEIGKQEITVDAIYDNFECQNDKYGLYVLEDGMKYVALTLTVKNNASSDALVSIYNFNCYADDKNCDQAFVNGELEGDLTTANISGGRAATVSAYFKVPVTAKKVEVEYENNMWSGKKLVIPVQ